MNTDVITTLFRAIIKSSPQVVGCIYIACEAESHECEFEIHARFVSNHRIVLPRELERASFLQNWINNCDLDSCRDLARGESSGKYPYLRLI